MHTPQPAIRRHVRQYGMTEVQIAGVKAIIVHATRSDSGNGRSILVDAIHQVRTEGDTMLPLPSSSQMRGLIAFAKATL